MGLDLLRLDASADEHRAFMTCEKVPIAWSFARGARAAAIVLLLHPPLAVADLVVPHDAIGRLNGATLDLGCTDLIVAGALQIGSGQVLNARNITIQSGGVVDGGSGAIELGGNWSNNGGFFAGTGTVRFRDLCAVATATISGSSSFANARFVTSIGKNYVFAVGSMQTITGLLEITGTTAQPIQFRSSAAGQVASINLAQTGTQQLANVGVTDVWATGQPLAPDLRNEGGGGNALGWFGTAIPPVAGIPALSPFMLSVLAALLMLVAVPGLRRRTSSPMVEKRARGARAWKARL
jgi:hypothetical protein